MSTKKRLFLLIVLYVSITILYFVIVLAGSNGDGLLGNSELTRVFTYSMFFPIYSFICGAATRLISCRKIVFVVSCALLTAQIIVSLYEIAFIYSISYGIHNLGLSYGMAAIGIMCIGYLTVTLIFLLSERVKAGKILRSSEVAMATQIKIDSPAFLRAYNKRYNRFERYLVWSDKAKRKQSSARIIYYDPVELLAVSEDKRVYVFFEEPKKAKLIDFEREKTH